MDLRERGLLTEAKFKTSRSSGKGGQNVNKVETRVELYFSVSGSMQLTEEEKEKLLVKLSSKLNDEGELRVVSSEDRSQLENKRNAIEKFYRLLENGLKEQKKRKKTKPTKASVKRRVEGKKKLSEKKALRSKNFL